MNLQASSFAEEVTEGMVIQIPQYTNNLRVNYVPDDSEPMHLVGVEFADSEKQTETQKRIIFSQDKSKMYFQAGTTDHGAIDAVKIIQH